MSVLSSASVSGLAWGAISSPPSCPAQGCFFCRSHGTGTWGTIAYAKKKGVNVYLLPLIDLKIFPDWLISTESCQLSLF